MSARISRASVSRSVATRGARSTAPATTATSCSLIPSAVQVDHTVPLHSIIPFHRKLCHIVMLLVERQALAVRLDLRFRSVYFFIFYFFIREYLPNRWTYLNKSLHGDGNWLGIEYGGFEFLRGVRLGSKNVTFCPDLPGVTFTKYNMAPKLRTISKIENCLVLAI